MRSDAHRSLEGEIPTGRKLGVEIVPPEGILRVSAVETVAVGTNVEVAGAVAIRMTATKAGTKVGVVKAAADGLSAVAAAEIADRPRGKRLWKKSSKPWRTPRGSRRGRWVKSASSCLARSSE
jgi:hypothetical protein